MKTFEKVYPDHRPWDVEPHYSKHISAMTSEELHSKRDIAIQLAWRDQEIERLAFQLKSALQQHEWVVATERMPHDNQKVWIVVDGEVSKSTCDAGGTNLGWYFNCKDGSWPADRVSHWMPRYVDPKPAPPFSAGNR